MSKAYINGTEVKIYSFDGRMVKALVPEIGKVQTYPAEIVTVSGADILHKNNIKKGIQLI